MALLRFLILTSLCFAGREALSVSDCGAYGRQPQHSDITVTCDTASVHLAIQICPVIYMGCNESLLRLNGMQTADCQGTLDTSVAPPVVRFSFPIRQGKQLCARRTGIFSDFSNMQTVNISGVVQSFDPDVSTVTYNTQLKYYYSCAYPLQYLSNNTQVDASSSGSLLKEQDGSFLSTLSMALYQDKNYTVPLVVPPLGVELRTNIYVQVFASNLMSQYFVLLDRCYAVTSPLPSNSTSFNLFNGVSQKARFYFPAFRFAKQQNEPISTYYLHCITRLCEPSTCSTLKQCNRKKRSVATTVKQDGITTPSELIVAVVTKAENALSGGRTDGPDASVHLGTAAVILSVTGVAAILMTASSYGKLK
ncbi:hypothetical protein Q5P01_010406 [Channa striata]|uniref:ZP domain-containing protein n=1 Tax=Channa striata TaxID=64152 RepID=A0AA88SYB9_CHASR|nr:hypothetical protein Q5P01_010406 [Channa striata]